MIIHVQFFAQLRDVIGTAETEVELADQATVADLLEAAYARWPQLRTWDKSLLIGLGVEFVGREHALMPNEQIAIMPPVQGG